MASNDIIVSGAYHLPDDKTSLQNHIKAYTVSGAYFNVIHTGGGSVWVITGTPGAV